MQTVRQFPGSTEYGNNTPDFVFITEDRNGYAAVQKILEDVISGNHGSIMGFLHVDFTANRNSIAVQNSIKQIIM